MISNAITLATLTSVGGYLVWRKLPDRARALVLRFPLITDVLALIGTYALFGGTVTALIAGALVSIVVSLLLHIANHPDDFAWLHDMLDRTQKIIQDIKAWLASLNQSYLSTK